MGLAGLEFLPGISDICVQGHFKQIQKKKKNTEGFRVLKQGQRFAGFTRTTLNRSQIMGKRSSQLRAVSGPLPDEFLADELSVEQPKTMEAQRVTKLYWKAKPKIDDAIESFIGPIALGLLERRIEAELYPELMAKLFGQDSKEGIEKEARTAALELMRDEWKRTDSGTRKVELLRVLFRKRDPEAVTEVEQLWSRYEGSLDDRLLQQLYYFDHKEAVLIANGIRRDYELERNPSSRQVLLQRLYYLGHSDSFAELLTRYQSQLQRLLGRYTKDDQTAADEQYQKLVLTLSQYRVRKSYEYNRPWISWVFLIARNTGVDGIRQRLKRPSHILPEAEGRLIDNREVSPQQSVEKAEVRDRLRTLVARLSVRDRLILRYRLEGLTLEQIGELVGNDSSWVQRLLHRALKEINQGLQEEIK